MSVPARFVQPAIEQIFQTMYFCEPVYRGQARVEGPATGTVLAFSGAATGEFRVIVSENLARRMTADFLALAVAEVSQDQIEAMVREFANVACGATMSLWIPAGDFRFSIPANLRYDNGPAELEHCFSVSDDRAEFAIGIALQPPL